MILQLVREQITAHIDWGMSDPVKRVQTRNEEPLLYKKKFKYLKLLYPYFLHQNRIDKYCKIHQKFCLIDCILINDF